MKPRVCIFAAETLLHWSSYYVRAFRQCCDVRVVGPAIVPEQHDYPDWPAVAHYTVPNDIHTTSDDAVTRLELLPEGWDPHLVVIIQSGDVVLRSMARVGCPTAYLSIDTWHEAREFQHGHRYDFVFLAQKALIKYMRRMGCCRVYCLPLACDPERHFATPDEENHYDLAFVGRIHYITNRQRAERLNLLLSRYRLGAYFGVGTDEMAVVYGRSTLVFNSSIACDVNMRVFEVLSTGRPLVTNRDAAANGLLELFEEGVHLICYDDDDLSSQVDRYLADPEAARAIGLAGQQEVHEKHTYVHRVTQIFDTLRAHNIDVGTKSYPRVRAGQDIKDLIPYGSLRLLDIGLGLGASRVAMAHRGVNYLAGVAPDSETMRRREKSYDEIWCGDAMRPPTGDFDTVLWTLASRFGSPVVSTLAYSREWLVEGGRLLLFMDDAEIQEVPGGPDIASLTTWFMELGCQLLTWYLPQGGNPQHLVIVSPVTTHANALNVDLYGEFPVNGVDREPWKVSKADPESDSPDAANP